MTAIWSSATTRGVCRVRPDGAVAPGPPATPLGYGLESKAISRVRSSMRKAAEGTTRDDLESQAWHFAQIG